MAGITMAQNPGMTQSLSDSLRRKIIQEYKKGNPKTAYLDSSTKEKHPNEWPFTGFPFVAYYLDADSFNVYTNFDFSVMELKPNKKGGMIHYLFDRNNDGDPEAMIMSPRSLENNPLGRWAIERAITGDTTMMKKDLQVMKVNEKMDEKARKEWGLKLPKKDYFYDFFMVYKEVSSPNQLKYFSFSSGETGFLPASNTSEAQKDAKVLDDGYRLLARRVIYQK